MKQHQLEDYIKFLNQVMFKIDKCFAEQKPYVFCKEGCSACCEKGEFPCSELEFEYLFEGFNLLDDELKKEILCKISQIKIKNDENNSMYECPFLINKRCAIYHYRPLICRTFGLMYFDKNEDLKVPFCHNLGLNYHQVYDQQKQIISDEMLEKSGIKQEPLAYNLSLSFLQKFGKNRYNLDFGEQKNIIDWMDRTNN